MLVNYFRGYLEEDARLQPAKYGGYSSASDYWQARLEVVATRGVRISGVRVCCNRDATMAVPLTNTHGRRFSALAFAPALPESVEGRASEGAVDEGSRVRMREWELRDSGSCAVHGFRVVALVSDFLCAGCQRDFEVATLEGIGSAGLVERCERMK
jgi:hypothetical protein